MLVELTKKDLRNLLKGLVPQYKHFEDPKVMNMGTWDAGWCRGTWNWNYEDENVTEEQLWELYLTVRI